MSQIWTCPKTRTGDSMRKDEAEFLRVLKDVLGPYGFSPTIASALRFFLRNPYESLVITNAQGKLEFLDRGSEKFFGLSEGEARGKRITDIVEDSCMPEVLQTRTPSIGRVFDVKGMARIGSTFPLIRNGKLVGAMSRLVFRSLEEVERMNRKISRLKKQVESLREIQKQQYPAIYTFDNIMGTSASLRNSVELAKKISTVETDVLIVGESGTGKELFAQAIHNAVNPSKPFVRVNSPAIPFELAESELFGYEKGAFSGAGAQGKPGRFELAEGGTVFMDEISSLPISIQAKLLRVLQEREVERLGGTRVQKVNFRLIAATNVDLKQSVDNGKFREDLYYRVAKAAVRIPPLRERKEDISAYVDVFLRPINERFGTRFTRLSAEASACLMNHRWPGNVRELINVLEQAALRQWEGEEIVAAFLPGEMGGASEGEHASRKALRKGVAEREREIIENALKQTAGNKRQTALLLGIPRSTLYKKIKDLGIAAE
jgi:transcriptional regulator with PAS, ATPase and Fis domain